jgi:hypothetical protein
MAAVQPGALAPGPDVTNKLILFSAIGDIYFHDLGGSKRGGGGGDRRRRPPGYPTATLTWPIVRANRKTRRYGV